VFKKIILAFCLLFFIGCEDKTETKNIEKDMKPYAGKTIMVIVPTLHANLVRGPILKEAKEFEKQTGAKIRVVTPSWSETINSIKNSVEPNSNIVYDIYTVIGLWNGTLLSSGKIIEKVPSWVKEKIDWEDVLPIYKNNILTWGNETYGLPYDGDNISLYYRKDIFSNKSYQKKFLKEFGYKLDVPKTWKEYIDISKFFNGWDWDGDGEIEHGNAGLRVKGDVSLLQFFAFAGAYAKHPNNKGYYFDPKTMKANISNPAFIKALQQYIELIKYGPLGMRNFAGHDVRDAFVKGEVALAIDWADLGTYAANSPYSVVKNSIGFATLPGAKKVYNYKTKQWEDIYNAPSSISGNWMMFVNKNSKNKKLAFEFASFMTSKDMTKKYIIDPGSAVNPSRYSHFKDPKSWQKAGFSLEMANNYLGVIKKSLTNKNVVTDIMIPGGEEYYSVLDGLVYDAIEGKLTPTQALETAAKKWDEITLKLGIEKQKQYYKDSINLR